MSLIDDCDVNVSRELIHIYRNSFPEFIYIYIEIFIYMYIEIVM